MAEEDAITRLVAEGGLNFIRTLTDAAIAQDRLTASISRAANLPPSVVASDISKAAVAFNAANVAAETFTGTLKSAGATDEVVAKLTSTIERQTKALLENADAAKQQADSIRATEQAQKKATDSFIQTVPRGTVTGTQRQDNGTFIAGVTKNFGQQQNFQNVLASNAQQQQTNFLQQQTAVRDAIEQRALQAFQAREQQRLRIAVEEVDQETAARKKAVQLQEQLSRETKANTLFANANPGIANGPKNIPSAGGISNLNAITGATKQVTTASNEKNRALNAQDAAHQQNTASGISYLSVLSAIHAGSFLATGTTFSLAGSLTTLGLVGAKVGQSFGVNPIFSGVLGVGAGVALIGVNALITGFEQLQTIAIGVSEAGIKAAATLVGIGAAGAVAATRLAGGLESVGSEIVAFGEPTEQQFRNVTAKIFEVSNATGIAATKVGEGASLFIRAGGDIEHAIDGGVAAVTRLTVAARGELVPTSAARAIVTITNEFQQQAITADKAVNILVGTAQKTALSFNEVTQAFQQAGPEAAQLNIPLLDLATTIGVVANQGLKGQLAGTGFKQFLLDLLRPSKEAREELNRLGISIADNTTGRIRPLRDIFEDMHRVLGQSADDFDKTAKASTAQSIAIIFGSRANLAAAIIARVGAEAFDQLKTSIAGVSAEDIVETLLAPTNAQLEIAKTQVENLATAFGGPLNVALGSVVRKFNEFLGTIDPSKLQSLSQGVIAAITGQGFAPLIEQINGLDNTRAKEFFTGLAESALTVRAAVVDTFLPALSGAAQKIQDAFAQIDITKAFTDITGGIVTVVNVGAGLVTFLGDVIADFVSGNQRGQELRSTLAGIATVVGTSLVGAFVAAAIPIALTISVLNATGEALIGLLSQMNNFNTIWDLSWQLAKDSVNNFLKATAPKLQAFGDFVIGIANHNSEQIQRGIDSFRSAGFDEAARNVVRGAGDIDKAILATSSTLQELTNKIATLKEEQAKPKIFDFGTPGNNKDIGQQIRDLEKERNDALGVFSTLQKLKQEGKTGTLSDTGIGAAIASANAQIEKLKNAPKIELSDIFGFAEGDLPDFFTNLSNRFQEFQATINRGTGERTSEPGQLPDPKAAKKLADQIANLQEDSSLKVKDILDDSATKEIDLRRHTYDKLLDVTSAFLLNRQKLEDDAVAQINENEAKFQQKLADRAFIEAAQRNIQELDRNREESNARRDLNLQQFDAANERREQRRIQDQEKGQSILEQLEQASQDRITSIQDTAFSRRQSDAATQFERLQGRQADAFQKQLQKEARDRDLAAKLANAKTPQERQQVQTNFTQSEADRRFQENQDARLLKFRESQENNKTAFSRGQEDVAFTHRITNEVTAFNFRVALENKYQTIRRALEDREFVRTDALAGQLLERRLGFSRDDFRFREQNTQSLQSAQDFLSTRDHQRELDHITEEKDRRKEELGTKLSADIFNIFDDADSTRTKNLEEQRKQLRAVGEQANRTARGIEETNGPTPALTRLLAGLDSQLVATDLLFLKNNDDARDLFNQTRTGVLQEFNVPLNAPTRDPLQSAAPLINPSAVGQAVRSADAANNQDLATAIAKALEPVVSGGDNVLSIAGNVSDTNDLLQLIQNTLFNRARSK